MSPNIAVSSFLEMIKINGIDVVMKKQVFKRERERYIAGLFLLGLRKHTGLEYWIKIDNEESPDIRAAWYEDGKKGRKENVLNIEIVEWEEHSKIDPVTLIKNKLKKSYPEYTKILCYIRGRQGTLDLEQYFLEISKIKINISEIFLLARIFNKKGDHGIYKLYPDKFQVEYFVNSEYKENIKQVDFIKTWLGMGNHIKDLGTYFHEFPKI